MLAGGEIFVSPSQSETAGVLFLDAMAAAKAIIATETDGTRELIIDPRALAPVKDPLALAAAISACLESKAFRTELGESLRSAAREKFGLDKMADATERLYRKLRGL